MFKYSNILTVAIVYYRDTSTQVCISLRFHMQKKGFSLYSQWIVKFSSLVHPANWLEIVRHIRDFRSHCLNFWLFIKKRCSRIIRSPMLYKTGVLKSFAGFTGKHDGTGFRTPPDDCFCLRYFVSLCSLCIWCSTRVFLWCSKSQRVFKVNNFVSVDFETQVFIWLLIIRTFCTWIVNKKEVRKNNSVDL